MIVKMARIVAIGPKEDLMDFLALVRKRGILHIDDRPPDKVNGDEITTRLRSLHLDRSVLSRRIFFEELRDKISRLLSILPPETSREPQLNAQNVVDSIAETVDQHLEQCRLYRERLEELRGQILELHRFREFLTAIAEIIPEEMDGSNLDHIGVEIRDQEAMADLEKLGVKLTDGLFEIATAKTESGKLVGVITTEKQFVAKIREALSGHQIYDYVLPAELSKLSFPDQIREARRLLPVYTAERDEIAGKLAVFAGRWRGIYLLARDWLDEQLALITTTASLFETEMCFVVSGWLPLSEFATLHELVDERFRGRVVVKEKEIREEDLASVPTMLRNRGYFEPFELFSRMLPIPAYGAFDITPFIAIFFPVFFGMMLGDMGYGTLVLIAALVPALKARNKTLRDIGRIFGVAAVYAIIFGLLYGEFFGVLGHRLFGLKPLLLNRHESMMPMLYFAMAMGFVHILVGLVLGMITSFKYQEKKEAVFKLASILVMLGLALVVGSSFSPHLAPFREPALLGLLIAVPVILISGGLLAPLELLKHFGNIVSYARIMAIGLTSVLLAHVANSMVGIMGSVWIGVIAGIMLHGFNIVLGIFAPTVHALRLHYVEFFSKIAGDGGREYHPLAKVDENNSAKKQETIGQA